MVCSVDSNQKVDQDFKIDDIKYHLDTKHEEDCLPPNTAVKPTNSDDAQHMARSVINVASSTTSEMCVKVPRAAQSIPWKKKPNRNKSLALKW